MYINSWVKAVLNNYYVTIDGVPGGCYFTPIDEDSSEVYLMERWPNSYGDTATIHKMLDGEKIKVDSNKKFDQVKLVEYDKDPIVKIKLKDLPFGDACYKDDNNFAMMKIANDNNTYLCDIWSGRISEFDPEDSVIPLDIDVMTGIHFPMNQSRWDQLIKLKYKRRQLMLRDSSKFYYDYTFINKYDDPAIAEEFNSWKDKYQFNIDRDWVNDNLELRLSISYNGEKECKVGLKLTISKDQLQDSTVSLESDYITHGIIALERYLVNNYKQDGALLKLLAEHIVI